MLRPHGPLWRSWWGGFAQRAVWPPSPILIATRFPQERAGACSAILLPRAVRVLEVVSGGNGAQHIDTCATLAVNFGLQGSVGSDFHSPHAWNPLGRSLKLPECVTPVWRSFGL